MIRKVLLIDDDPIALCMTEYVLKCEDFADEILKVSDGKAALNNLAHYFSGRGEQVAPQLIFLDLDMPGMNGWDFLKNFHACYASKLAYTQIVILSASCTGNNHLLAQKYPMVAGCFNKPLSVEGIRLLKKNQKISACFK